MPAILRNNAATAKHTIGEAKMGRGGSGKAPLIGTGASKVRRRLRKPADPAAELMPAAEFLGHETDYHAILEEFRDSPFNPARRKQLGRLMGMFAMDYQGARPVERRFLRRLLAARNAREGYVANRALHLCAAPHVIRRTLALGVAESRFASGPMTGFLGAVQARVAATTLRLLGPRGREHVWNLLTRAGTDDAAQPLAAADRVLERALILKALAARRHRLGPWSKDGQTALDELSEFAGGIRGRTRRALATCTTLVVHPEAKTVAAIDALSDAGERAGTIARGEIDPIFAWRQHADGGEQVGAEIGKEERDEALPDLDRSPIVERPRLHQALAEARAAEDGRMKPEMRTALTDHLSGRTLRHDRLDDKNAALRVLSDKAFDVAGEKTVEAIRDDACGIYKFDAARALGDLLSRYTGATYVRRLFSDQLTAGGDPLGQIARALESGLTVPITVNELKAAILHAFAAVGLHVEPGEEKSWEVDLQLPHEPDKVMQVPAKLLLQPVLPEAFGRKARADAYMAPAALDLLAPPFGIPFPELGIEDRL